MNASESRSTSGARSRDPSSFVALARHRGVSLPWVVGVVLLVALVIGAWFYFHSSGDGSANGASGGTNASGAAGAGGGAPGAGGGGASGKGKRGPGGAMPPAPVGVATAKQSDLKVYIDGLGSVTPRATVTVHTQVAGQLLRVLYQEGQMVHRDQLLAEIDPRPFQAALDQAQGTLMRDQALLDEARIDLVRYTTLFAQDSVAKQTLDTQVALVRQYEGTVKTDQGALDAARVNLTYTRITAPVAGRVGLRQVDPGNLVQMSDTNGIVIITQLQPIDVEYIIPQDDIPRVTRAMHGKEPVAVDSFDRENKNKLASGAVLTMDNQIDVTTGTVKMKASFPNQDLALFPNQFVNTHMLVEVLKDATVIPSSAVQRGSIGTFVFAVTPDKTVTVHQIKLGPSDKDSVAVVSGVNVGDVLVVDGADKLKEGAKVEPIDRAAAASAPAGKSGAEGGGHKRRDASAIKAEPGAPGAAPAADQKAAATPGQ